MTIECCSWPYLLTKAALFVLSPVSESPPHFSQNFILYSSKLREIFHKGKTLGYRLLYVDKQPFVRSQNQRRSFLTNLDFMIWPSRVLLLSALLEFGVFPHSFNSGDIAKFQKWTSLLFLKLYSAKNRCISILCDIYI